MPLRDCGGCLNHGFWPKLLKMKSDAVENFYVNSAAILTNGYFLVGVIPKPKFTVTALGLDRNPHETPKQGASALEPRPRSCRLKDSAGLPF